MNDTFLGIVAIVMGCYANNLNQTPYGGTSMLTLLSAMALQLASMVL